MNNLLKLLATTWLLLSGPLALAVSSFSAEYEIFKGPLKLGVMSRRLQIASDSTYVFESKMETKGLASLFVKKRVIETSRGRIEDARFVPEYYRYSKNDKDKDYELRFDYAANVVAGGISGAPWSAPMPALLLDKLVYQAQLMFDVGADPSGLDYAIADRSKLKQYLIANMGHERIDTAFGRFDTIKLERRDNDSKRRTTVWCAQALDWMPIKVEYHDKRGSVTRASLRSLPTAPVTADFALN